LVFLGTGTSHGVPAIGCGCATCRSPNEKNRRTRCSVALGLPQGNLLVDTPPDMRFQLLREGIGLIHAVIYTHEHVDHLFGLDDLRIFSRYLGTDLPVYCNEPVRNRIHKAFDYAFDPITRDYPAGGVPRLELRPIGDEPFDVLGMRVIPIRLGHGRFQTLGYRFGNIAYCTDTNEIPPQSMRKLQGLDVLVLDCLRPEPHVSHFSLSGAIEMAQRLAPRRTLFTHMSHRLEHEATAAALPPAVELAYDGMTVPLS